MLQGRNDTHSSRPPQRPSLDTAPCPAWPGLLGTGDAPLAPTSDLRQHTWHSKWGACSSRTTSSKKKRDSLSPDPSACRTYSQDDKLFPTQLHHRVNSFNLCLRNSRKTSDPTRKESPGQAVAGDGAWLVTSGEATLRPNGLSNTASQCAGADTTVRGRRGWGGSVASTAHTAHAGALPPLHLIPKQQIKCIFQIHFWLPWPGSALLTVLSLLTSLVFPRAASCPSCPRSFINGFSTQPTHQGFGAPSSLPGWANAQEVPDPGRRGIQESVKNEEQRVNDIPL